MPSPAPPAPPYEGLDASGDYLVAKRLPGVVSGAFDFIAGPGEWLTMGGISFGAHNMAVAVTSDMIGIIAASAGFGTAGRYHFGVPQFADIVLPKVPVDETYRLDLSKELPPVPSPWGQVGLPNLINAEMIDSNNKLRFTVDNPAPGEYPGTIAVRALFANGTHQDVHTLSGTFAGTVDLDPATFFTDDDTDRRFAIGAATWQLVRLIPTSGIVDVSLPPGPDILEFPGNTIRIAPRTDMAAYLTRTGVEFVRQDNVIGHVNLLEKLGTPNDLENTYLTGRKIQPIVFTDDLSRVYVGGNGKIYAIDMLTFKLLGEPIKTYGGNITSLATAGNLLLIGEGSNGTGYGATAPNNSRLLVMDISPGSAKYHTTPVSLKDTGIEATPYGITGMAIGPDGRTLVVATPKQWTPISIADPAKRGDVLIFDLATLNLKTGEITAPTKAVLPSDGIGGKVPETITATHDSDRFLVANIADYDRGLSTLVITRDAQGKITGAQMNAIKMSQPDSKVIIDRLDIQRAQSAVLVTYKGVEYAIISDDNVHFLDTYWQAMYKAPNFLWTPSGPPIAYGGSVSAKKVAVGGKLGIVKDPFGTPQFLGATLPLDGYGIVNLGLSENGKVLIGQLKGGFSANIADWASTKPNQSYAWNVDALIEAALAVPEDKRLTKHLKLPDLAEQRVSASTGPVAGTFFDEESVEVSVTGRMGDIIGVNLRELAARQLLVKESKATPGKFTQKDADTPMDKLSSGKQDMLRARMNQLSGFSIARAELDSLSDRNNNWKPRLELIVQKKPNGSLIKDANGAPIPVSRVSENSAHLGSTVIDDFKNSGIVFFSPVITGEDEDKLRLGNTLTDNFAGLFFTYVDAARPDTTGKAQEYKGSALIFAEDYARAPTLFFGDRPLENPGYSAFKLKGAVGVGQTNDVLDVYRVEQRLKYLGFPAIGTGTGNTLKNFDVNGSFTDKEEAALKLFEKVVRYGPGNTRFYTGTNPAADGKIEGIATTEDLRTINWLNAYNAPHWMQLFAETGLQTGKDTGTEKAPKYKGTNRALPNWESTQTGTRAGNIEVFGTSWLYDLMVAADHAYSTLLDGRTLRFTGSLDANLKKTPKGYVPNGLHVSHDLGMAFDLGILDYINTGVQGDEKDPLLSAISKLDSVPWSVANALAYTQPTLASGAQGLPDTKLPAKDKNDQISALRDFLSLYALTRSDKTAGNGTWDYLPVKNGEAVRAALFGSGEDAGGLISKVLIGDAASKKNPLDNNPYRNINTILDRLGINANPVDGHQDHYHIYLRPPKLKTIDPPKNLLANGGSDAVTDQAVPATTEAQALLAHVSSLLNTGEELMFIMDVPYVPVEQPPIVLAAGTSTTTNAARQPSYLLKDCQGVPSTGDPRSAQRSVDPAYMLKNYIQGRDNRYVDLADFKNPTLVEGPKHGKMTRGVDTKGFVSFGFDPTPEFIGKDRAVFTVEYKGKLYKIVMDFVVDFTIGQEHEYDVPYCPKPKLIEIKNPASGSSGDDLNGIPISFTDLGGGALGQTTGTTITLDTNAAGHGWYIDYTPYLNEEYLPTANPNVWQAKEGSDAAGKMDMLSVLLHEYGHVLGIEHSADQHASMASTLTSGTRRLPNADELALMAQLVGEVKTGLTSTPETPPTSPLPLGTALGGFWLARMRKSGPGEAPAPSSANTDPSATPRYAVAANATLTNPAFTGGTGWSTSGTVTFDSGAATLTESATAQTRLNQLFVLGAQDRFLRFTLDNITLDDVNGAPDAVQGGTSVGSAGRAGPTDAFEVALIDANTGLPLLGGTGLTRSDALLNLQADGTERIAPQVTRTLNSDDVQGGTSVAGAGSAGVVNESTSGLLTATTRSKREDENPRIAQITVQSKPAQPKAPEIPHGAFAVQGGTSAAGAGSAGAPPLLAAVQGPNKPLIQWTAQTTNGSGDDDSTLTKNKKKPPRTPGWLDDFIGGKDAKHTDLAKAKATGLVVRINQGGERPGK